MKIINTGLKKALTVAACTTALLATTTLFTHAAISQSQERADLTYNVYIGSSKMFKIGFQTTLTKKSYHARMKLKPKGLAKLFANVSMEMNVSGKVLKDRIKPEKFTFYRKKKKRKRTSKVKWLTAALPAISRSYSVSSSKQANILKAINPNVLDPLSAFLRLGITDAKAPCGKSQRVFDGGKVYDLKFKFLGKSHFNSGNRGTYRGPAFKCRISHKPVAGYSRKDLRKAKANQAVFIVWFAPVKSALLKKQILLPIAATGKVKGRAFSAFARKASFAGTKL